MHQLFDPFSEAESRSPMTPMVIGIGSPHGDDRAGWEVVERLGKQPGPAYQLRKAAVPHDILDWLQPEIVTHLVDANNLGVAEIGCYHVRYAPHDAADISLVSRCGQAAEQLWLRSSSSHHFDLLATLRLAAVLKVLPDNCTLWTIPVVAAEKNGAVHPRTTAYIAECVSLLTRKLEHA
jgi:Ni,Fe-hydrogenase maturation factor